MKGFADQFFGILESNGLAIDNLANKSKGVSSYFSKLQMGKLDDSLRNATVENILPLLKTGLPKARLAVTPLPNWQLRNLSPCCKQQKSSEVRITCWSTPASFLYAI